MPRRRIAWQLLPLELGFGSGRTCWRRLERWQHPGVFDQLHRILLAPVDDIPPVAGRLGRPRRRPDSLLGVKGYDSHRNPRELRKRRILPTISRKGAPNM